MALATTTRLDCSLGGTAGDADTILLQTVLLQNPLASNLVAEEGLSIRTRDASQGQPQVSFKQDLSAAPVCYQAVLILPVVQALLCCFTAS